MGDSNPVPGHPAPLFRPRHSSGRLSSTARSRDLRHLLLLWIFPLFFLVALFFFRLLLCRFFSGRGTTCMRMAPQPQHYSALLAEGKTHAHTAQLHNQKDCQQYSPTIHSAVKPCPPPLRCFCQVFMSSLMVRHFPAAAAHRFPSPGISGRSSRVFRWNARRNSLW